MILKGNKGYNRIMKNILKVLVLFIAVQTVDIYRTDPIITTDIQRRVDADQNLIYQLEIDRNLRDANIRLEELQRTIERNYNVNK
jgi:hypothetical protein